MPNNPDRPDINEFQYLNRLVEVWSWDEIVDFIETSDRKNPSWPPRESKIPPMSVLSDLCEKIGKYDQVLKQVVDRIVLLHGPTASLSSRASEENDPDRKAAQQFENLVADAIRGALLELKRGGCSSEDRLKLVRDATRGCAFVLLGAALRLHQRTAQSVEAGERSLLDAPPVTLEHCVSQLFSNAWETAVAEEKDGEGSQRMSGMVGSELDEAIGRPWRTWGQSGKDNSGPGGDDTSGLLALVARSLHRDARAGIDEEAPRERGNAARGLDLQALGGGHLCAVTWARKGQEIYWIPRELTRDPERCWASREPSRVESFTASMEFSRAVDLFPYRRRQQPDEPEEEELLLVTYEVPHNEDAPHDESRPSEGDGIAGEGPEDVETRILIRSFGVCGAALKRFELDCTHRSLDTPEVLYSGSVRRLVLESTWMKGVGADVASPDSEVFWLADEACSVGRGESVFSSLQLEPGLLMLGLRGTNGYPRVGLLLLPECLDTAEETALPTLLILDRDLGLSRPQGRSSSILNGPLKKLPVRALCMVDGRQGEPDEHTVLAGCENGLVVQLAIPRADSLRRYLEPTELADARALPLADIRFELVDEASSAVFALSTRLLDRKGEQYGEMRRVYVSSASAVLECWECDVDNGHDARPVLPLESNGRRLRSWVSHGPDISVGLHPLTLPSDAEPEPVDTELKIAVQQSGSLIVFTDDAQFRETGEHHSRPRPPGTEVGRVPTQGAATVFASAMLPGSIGRKPDEPLAHLIVGTGDRELVRVPIPTDTLTAGLRSKIHRGYDIVRRADEQRQLFSTLRVGDVLYGIEPMVARLLVRATFDPEQGPVLRPSDDRRFEFPRWLRPLRDLDAILRAIGERNPTVDTDRVADLLHLSLMRIHRMGAASVFSEVIKVVLRSSNRALADCARKVHESPGERGADWVKKTVDFAVRIVAEIRRIEHLHAGRDEQTRVLMAIVENLLDGDTFWALTLADTKLDRRFADVLASRAAVAQQLLLRSASWVPEATLRSANRALIQVGKRSRKDGRRVTWSSLESYFASVRGRVSIANRRELRSKAVLQHELARTYALGCLLCPEQVVAITTMALESEEPLVYRGMLQQVEVLAQLGLEEDTEDGGVLSVEVLRMAEAIIDVDAPMEVSGQKALLVHRLESESNRALLDQVRAIRGVRSWILELATGLRESIANLDLGGSARRTWREAAEVFQWSEECGRGLGERAGDYRHSSEFLRRFVQSVRSCFDGLDARRPRQPVRPKEVLATLKLYQVCDQFHAELVGEGRDALMREPFRGSYRRAIRQLRDAARDFAGGPELQRNLVEGILGHGILERLDEQALELHALSWELHPPLLWGGDRIGPEGEDRSAEAELGSYLRKGAEAIETIPTTLRNLERVLTRSPYKVGEPDVDSQGPEERRLDPSKYLEKLVWDQMLQCIDLDDPEHELEGLDRVKVRDWRLRMHRSAPLAEGEERDALSAVDAQLDDRETGRIGLTISELFQNHAVHFDPEGRGSEEPPARSVEFLVAPTDSELREFLELNEELSVGRSEEQRQDFTDATERLDAAVSEARIWQHGRALRHPARHDDETTCAVVRFGVAIKFTSRRVVGERLADDLARTRRLFRAEMEEPFDPRPLQNVPSYGTGLYLANLAAASCGWRLRGWLMEQHENMEHGPITRKGEPTPVIRLAFFLYRSIFAPAYPNNFAPADEGCKDD